MRAGDACSAIEAITAGSCPLKILLILNDAPYGSERCYNALRLANAVRKRDAGTEVTVFLMADAVLAAKKGQKRPDGYYNVERMLKSVIAGKGTVLLCGSCMDARGITEEDVVEGTRRSSMDAVAAACVAADKAIVF